MPGRAVIDYASRIHHLKKSLRRKGLDGFLVTDMNNIRYLTGFSGSSGFLLISGRENFFITDFRYKEQSENEVRGWDIIIEKRDRIQTIQTLSKKTGIQRLGFESSLSYGFFERLSDTRLRLHAIEGLIEKIRGVKDTHEINSIKEAVKRAEGAFLDVKPHIRHGTREISIALRLEERLKKRGCRHIPFDIIVASGPNSAMPHARQTQRKFKKGDFVIIDWGGETDGYFSDMTRTLLMKGDHGLDQKREIYRIVLEANRKAISSISPGLESKKIDKAARDVIKKAGYGEFFGHGTGHGVGLQVHESPRVTWNRSDTIRENMVFTIEPGIYIPGLGGVRIEDMVIVRERGAEVLTSLPKELEIV